MGEKGRPMYYGGGNRAIYYGGSVRPVYYGGGSPTAYGGAKYGGAYYYGGGVGDGGGEGSDESLMGAITLGRLLRVCMQRWVTIVVFVIIGFVVAFAVFEVSPRIFEAVSVFEMTPRPSNVMGQKTFIDVDAGSSMNEIFNTRAARLRSRAILERILSLYRTEHSSSTVTDEELLKTLQDTKMELKRMSRLISISVRSTDARLATDLANVYAKAAEMFTSELNRASSEDAVLWFTSMTDQEKRSLERTDESMLDFHIVNQLDFMMSEREIAQLAAKKINVDILELEGDIIKATELRKTLEIVQSDPEKFGSLPDSVPRSQEIGMSYQMLQKILAEKNALLARFTASHPEVKIKEKEVEVYKQQFADVVFRALETCKANLDFSQRHLAKLTPRQNELTQKMQELGDKIAKAKLRIEQLDRDREVAGDGYKAILQRMRDAQLAADSDTAIIKQVEPAFEPIKPVLPNPLVIFPAGPVIGLLLGLLFVLVLDHLEDKIVGISDIEHRLHLKALAVLPHVRRMKREQLARLVSDDKFSQFAEAIAGLRNLLDSPRYQEMSKVLLCMSTQPGEGKTVTSCSLAASCAQSGQRTLLVDFDMRRPRLARIYEKKPGDFRSLPHTLAEADVSLFDTLPVPSGVENLDIVFSKASTEISPANLMGSGIIVEFFAWARQHYDRVVIDSPPFGIVGDVMTLSSLVDAVMILCCPDRTRFQPIRHAARHLTESGARIIGVIVNDVDFGHRSHFSQYDYHYRYAYTSHYGSDGDRDTAKRIKASAAPAGAAAPAGQPVYEDDLTPAGSSGPVAREDIVDLSMTDDE
jgi:capsular exopolysaccharide synthesis family protein